MRERDWTNPAPAAGDVIEAGSLSIRCLDTGGAAVVSGDLDAALAALAPGAPMIGLLSELPVTGAFALRIARDRMLLCTPAPLMAAPGWHGTYALSRADDLYRPVAITGDSDGLLLAGCMSAEPGSPSAMTLFAGKPCLVARAGDGVRVWVPGPDMAGIWSRLRLLAAA